MARAYKHACSMCGQPTASVFPVCDRPGPCHNEYTRLQRTSYRKQRNATVMRYYRRQRHTSSVYAVWLPRPQVVKVGFTLNANSSLFAGSARTRAQRRGWDTEDSRGIWQRPGDTRVEAWMQATLAFRWRRTYERGTRLCEWFLVPALTEAEIIEVLNEVYELVPADLVNGTPIACPPEEDAAPSTQLEMF